MAYTDATSDLLAQLNAQRAAYLTTQRMANEVALRIIAENVRARFGDNVLALTLTEDKHDCTNTLIVATGYDGRDLHDDMPWRESTLAHLADIVSIWMDFGLERWNLVPDLLGDELPGEASEGYRDEWLGHWLVADLLA